MNKEFEVCFDQKRIAISVGDEILQNLDKSIGKQAPNRPLYFIIDALIYEKYAGEFGQLLTKSDRYFFTLNGGKSNKTFATAMRVFADLEEKNISRDSVIVAVGGGVIGDLAGFVASCWYRGVDLIHIPTTLLAAVDSSLGGKTALNFRHTVNAIGTYHHPLAILVDTSVLFELPDREISSGLAEAIKYAVLGSEEMLRLLENTTELSEENIAEIVALSLSQKAKFVNGDVKESANRLFLNFGHTIGHAIEFSTVVSGEEMLRHGEGVALGMIAVFRICASVGLIEDSEVTKLKELLAKFGLPTEFYSSSMSTSRDLLIDLIVERSFKDKKRTREGLRLVLIRGWGHPELYVTSDSNLIRIGVEEVIK